MNKRVLEELFFVLRDDIFCLWVNTAHTLDAYVDVGKMSELFSGLNSDAIDMRLGQCIKAAKINAFTLKDRYYIAKEEKIVSCVDKYEVLELCFPAISLEDCEAMFYEWYRETYRMEYEDTDWDKEE